MNLNLNWTFFTLSFNLAYEFCYEGKVKSGKFKDGPKVVFTLQALA